MPIDKPKTSFTEVEKTQFGIGRAKFINIFDNCIIQYGEPLCGYLQFHISKKNYEKKYTKLRCRIMDSRHKKIKFEVDFVKQKEHDPNN